VGVGILVVRSLGGCKAEMGYNKNRRLGGLGGGNDLVTVAVLETRDNIRIEVHLKWRQSSHLLPAILDLPIVPDFCNSANLPKQFPFVLRPSVEKIQRLYFFPFLFIFF